MPMAADHRRHDGPQARTRDRFRAADRDIFHARRQSPTGGSCRRLAPGAQQPAHAHPTHPSPAAGPARWRPAPRQARRRHRSVRRCSSPRRCASGRSRRCPSKNAVRCGSRSDAMPRPRASKPLLRVQQLPLKVGCLLDVVVGRHADGAAFLQVGGVLLRPTVDLVQHVLTQLQLRADLIGAQPVCAYPRTPTACARSPAGCR